MSAGIDKRYLKSDNGKKVFLKTSSGVADELLSIYSFVFETMLRVPYIAAISVVAVSGKSCVYPAATVNK